MKSRPLTVSVLYNSGAENPAFRELLTGMDNLQLLKGARGPEDFLAQYQDRPPDLVLVELNGACSIPDWLQPLIAQLPHSEVMVCSHSRDPEFLIRILQLRVGGFLPVPLNRDDLLATVERVREAKEKHGASGLSQILAVIGTKGGVGVTAVATNLAVAMAEDHNREVILVDLARPFPQVGHFLDLKSQHTIKDLIVSSGCVDPLFLQKVVQRDKSNLAVLLGQPYYNPEAGEALDLKCMGNIFETLRNFYDDIFVDLGMHMDPLYVRVLQEADQILIITQLSVPDLQNLKGAKILLREWGIEDSKIKIVVNRYTKDHSLGLKDIENAVYHPVFQTLPNDFLTLIEAINQGISLRELAPRSKLWRKIKSVAAELAAAAPGQKQAAAGAGFFSRLFFQ